MSEYKGFSLFNDVDDAVLRCFNRARVLTNIAEDHAENNRISPKGAMLILGYFGQIPMDERETLQAEFSKQMKSVGFQIKA